MTDLYIGSIPFKWKEKDLEALFSPFGEITSCKIIIDKRSRQNKGFGFVTFKEADSARHAIQALDNSEQLGRTISVTLSVPKKEEAGAKLRPPGRPEEKPARKSFFSTRKKY